MTTMQTTYDAIPYRSLPFPQTRPEHLAAIARLFGLNTPAIEQARVLELGCSMGGNLILMAQNYPGSKFVGIDASARQISEGWKTIDALGAKNVELKQQDILEIDGDLGEFDYIISHGVYSWVPAAVQKKLLEICKRHLAANGVAYVSYNTYPGWHIRGIVRDMMLFHGTQFKEPATRLAQAKALVAFVAQSSRDEASSYQKLLQGELEMLGKSADYYVHHDHLEENNHPVYFHEFASRLAVNGLQYLGEADFSTMVSTNFAPEIAKTLNDIGAHDILQMEQYMDFLRCRYFRQTLLCHSAVRLNRRISPQTLKGLQLSSHAVPDSAELSIDPEKIETFRTGRGRAVNCRSPLTKLALVELRNQWPMPVAFEALYAKARSEAEKSGHAGDNTGEDFFGGEMLTCMAAGIVEWHLAPPPYTTLVGKTPAATAAARLQAKEGRAVSNMRGETIMLDELHRQVLMQLDGSRNRKQLADDLTRFVKSGGHTLTREGSDAPVTDEKEMRELIDSSLEKVLQNLAWNRGQKEVTIQLTDRVIISPYAAKRLTMLLDGVVKEYEKRFGALNVEGPQQQG